MRRGFCNSVRRDSVCSKEKKSQQGLRGIDATFFAYAPKFLHVPCPRPRPVRDNVHNSDTPLSLPGTCTCPRQGRNAAFSSPRRICLRKYVKIFAEIRVNISGKPYTYLRKYICVFAEINSKKCGERRRKAHTFFLSMYFNPKYIQYFKLKCY